jgi:hypothetical protein
MTFICLPPSWSCRPGKFHADPLVESLALHVYVERAAAESTRSSDTGRKLAQPRERPVYAKRTAS